MYILLLLFILIPIIEITVFIWTGAKIGALPVIFLILFSGIAGVLFVRYQGLETLRKIQFALYNRQPPGNELLDGLCIIIGGILLVTPGFVTDIIGFFIVLPWTRRYFRKLLYAMIMKQMAKRNYIFRRY